MVAVEISKKYIIQKHKDGILIEQHVTIDDIDEYDIDEYDNGDKVYSYYYGVLGFHEGFATINQIRMMTPQEQEWSDKNQFWLLPQQFYQSMPA